MKGNVASRTCEIASTRLDRSELDGYYTGTFV